MSTRFTVALHILTLLAAKRGEALNSAFIASSVQTNPVVIRRILSRLREAGLVNAIQGPGGGFVLASDAADVTLRDVYEAVEERTLIAVHPEGNPRCPVGRNIGPLLDRVTGEAEEAMLKSLASTTLASLVRKVQRCAKAV